MRAAGESEAADHLLLDPAWMQAKLNALGIQALLADYVLQPKQNAFFVIGATLTLVANVLTRRPQELPAQLLARLSLEMVPELASFLERVEARLVGQVLFDFDPLSRRPAPNSAASRGMRIGSPA